MGTKAKSDFAQRLNKTLDACGVKSRGRASEVHKQFLLRDIEITQPAIRKWLEGESLPGRSNILILAAWLGVRPEWLEYGQEDENYAIHYPPVSDLSVIQRRLDDMDQARRSVVGEVISLITDDKFKHVDLLMLRSIAQRLSSN